LYRWDKLATITGVTCPATFPLNSKNFHFDGRQRQGAAKIRRASTGLVMLGSEMD